MKNNPSNMIRLENNLQTTVNKYIVERKKHTNQSLAINGCKSRVDNFEASLKVAIIFRSSSTFWKWIPKYHSIINNILFSWTQILVRGKQITLVTSIMGMRSSISMQYSWIIVYISTNRKFVLISNLQNFARVKERISMLEVRSSINNSNSFLLQHK